MLRRTFLAAGSAAVFSSASTEPPIPNRPKVAGLLELRARRREGGSVSERMLQWRVAETAVILCDVWDTHTCHLAAMRVAAMAPRIDAVVGAARSLGVMIIHSPSDTMKFYEGTLGRRRMQAAPASAAATPILARCPREGDEAKSFPIDDSEGGCDDPIVKPWTGPYPWTRQHPAIGIGGFDGISESGQEIYNYCRQEGIKNLALLGVHTNICILNRSFGVRQMTRLGFNVAVVRDLTDAMYDPRKRPFVSHARGTELVVEHIETNWCPSILSGDLMRVTPGSSGPG